MPSEQGVGLEPAEAGPALGGSADTIKVEGCEPWKGTAVGHLF